MAAGERVPLLISKDVEAAAAAYPAHPQRLTLRRCVKIVVGAGMIFFVAAGAARLFPRDVSGRASLLKGVDLDESVVRGAKMAMDETDGTTMHPVRVTTVECAGDTNKPAVEGFDVVAYRYLQPGTHGIRGSKDFSTVYGQGYTFRFSTLENKLEFESNPERYLPAWGGFCSYGISHEIFWSADVLGPPSNPDFWLIEDDRLFLFRSAMPFGKFQETMANNIKHGDAMWNLWFGEPGPPGTEVMTPFDTACFCSEELCADG